MLSILMRKTLDQNLQFNFIRSDGKIKCILYPEDDEDKSEWKATGTNFYQALKSALKAAGLEEVIADSARQVSHAKDRTDKQRKTSAENGKKGGRPVGSKGRTKRSRSK